VRIEIEGDRRSRTATTRLTTSQPDKLDLAYRNIHRMLVERMVLTTLEADDDSAGGWASALERMKYLNANIRGDAIVVMTSPWTSPDDIGRDVVPARKALPLCVQNWFTLINRICVERNSSREEHTDLLFDTAKYVHTWSKDVPIGVSPVQFWQCTTVSFFKKSALAQALNDETAQAFAPVFQLYTDIVEENIRVRNIVSQLQKAPANGEPVIL